MDQAYGCMRVRHNTALGEFDLPVACGHVPFLALCGKGSGDQMQLAAGHARAMPECEAALHCSCDSINVQEKFSVHHHPDCLVQQMGRQHTSVYHALLQYWAQGRLHSCSIMPQGSIWPAGITHNNAIFKMLSMQHEHVLQYRSGLDCHGQAIA